MTKKRRIMGWGGAGGVTLRQGRSMRAEDAHVPSQRGMSNKRLAKGDLGQNIPEHESKKIDTGES